MFFHRRSHYLTVLALITLCITLYFCYPANYLAPLLIGDHSDLEPGRHPPDTAVNKDTADSLSGGPINRVAPYPWKTTATTLVPFARPSTQPEPASGEPRRVPVVGLVFYGRRAKVELLDCHLQKALNRGWLDEVVWLANTNNTDDLAYLHDLVERNPKYKLVDQLAGEGYMHGYDFLAEWPACQPDCIVLKADDDIIWIDDETIPQLTAAAIKHPEHFLVSANVIVSPLMAKIHLSRGALHSYLPNQEVVSSQSHASWDYHDYPRWTGPQDFSLRAKDERIKPQSLWLPSGDISKTPLRHVQYNEWGNGFMAWMIAHQQHLSLLHNIRDGRLDKYWARTGEFFFPKDHRLSINLFAMNSTYILDSLPMAPDDDEYTFAVKEPHRRKKRVAIKNSAIAAHYGFRFMQPEIDQTDALARYRNYTFTHVCPKQVP